MGAEEGRVVLLWGSGHCQLGCSHPSGWPHTRVQTGSTGKSQGFAKSNSDNDDDNNINKKNMMWADVRTK